MDCRDVALQRAVGFDGNKAALCSKALALCVDHSGVVRIDFRDDHRDIRRPAMRAVVGHDRAFRLCIGLFQRFNFIFLHVDRAEDKVYHRSDLFHVGGGVEDDHVFHGFRHGRAHGPAVSHSLLIGFAGGPAARSERFDVKPGMIFQERCKPLAYHAGCSDDSNLICFHDTFPPI